MSKSEGAVGPDEGLQRLGLGGPVEFRLRLQHSVRVEAVGDEAVVLDASGEIVHRATGDAVQRLELLADGVAVADVLTSCCRSSMT